MRVTPAIRSKVEAALTSTDWRVPQIAQYAGLSEITVKRMAEALGQTLRGRM